MKPELSIVIVNFRSSSLLSACLRSLRDPAGAPDREILVYDNGPEDEGLRPVLDEYPEARLVAGGSRLSFGGASNACAAESVGGYILFLNPDTEAEPGALRDLLAAGKELRGAGVVGPRLVDDTGGVELSWAADPGLLSEMIVRIEKSLPSPARSLLSKRTVPKRVDWVSGAAMLVKRDAFERTGGFDREYPLYFEDADLCRRIRHEGWGVWHDPRPRFLHRRGGTIDDTVSRERRYRKGQVRYYAKHRGPIERSMLRAYLRVRRRGGPDPISSSRSGD